MKAYFKKSGRRILSLLLDFKIVLPATGRRARLVPEVGKRMSRLLSIGIAGLILSVTLVGKCGESGTVEPTRPPAVPSSHRRF